MINDFHKYGREAALTVLELYSCHQICKTNFIAKIAKCLFDSDNMDYLFKHVCILLVIKPEDLGGDECLDEIMPVADMLEDLVQYEDLGEKLEFLACQNWRLVRIFDFTKEFLCEVLYNNEEAVEYVGKDVAFSYRNSIFIADMPRDIMFAFY